MQTHGLTINILHSGIAIFLKLISSVSLFSNSAKDCNQRRKEHEYLTYFYKSNQNKYAAVRQKNIRNVEETLNHK